MADQTFGDYFEIGMKLDGFVVERWYCLTSRLHIENDEERNSRKLEIIGYRQQNDALLKLYGAALCLKSGMPRSFGIEPVLAIRKGGTVIIVDGHTTHCFLQNANMQQLVDEVQKETIENLGPNTRILLGIPKS